MPPKKAAKKHAPPTGNDLRRAWEHLGRTEKLLPLMGEQDRPGLIDLVKAARTLVQNGPAKQAADLLRAAEHLAFACIDTPLEDPKLSANLVECIVEEYEHLLSRADDHWDKSDCTEIIGSMYARMRRDARSRMKERRYREALEFARGAEALTHVRGKFDSVLTNPKTDKRLRNTK